MKRAKRLEIRARSFERKIGTDHLDDVVRRSNLFDGFRWDRSHEMLDFSLVWLLGSDVKLTQCVVAFQI